MAQRAEHHYDYNDSYNPSGAANKWIWGVLAALAALAVIVWFASAGGPSSTTIGVSDQSQPAAGATTGSTDPATPAAGQADKTQTQQ
jgi:hypothetical protein